MGPRKINNIVGLGIILGIIIITAIILGTILSPPQYLGYVEMGECLPSQNLADNRYRLQLSIVLNITKFPETINYGYYTTIQNCNSTLESLLNKYIPVYFYMNSQFISAPNISDWRIFMYIILTIGVICLLGLTGHFTYWYCKKDYLVDEYGGRNPIIV